MAAELGDPQKWQQWVEMGAQIMTEKGWLKEHEPDELCPLLEGMEQMFIAHLAQNVNPVCAAMWGAMHPFVHMWGHTVFAIAVGMAADLEVR